MAPQVTLLVPVVMEQDSTVPALVED